MAFRSEMTIPINKDPRTFEQQRSDLFSKLEQTHSTEATQRNQRINKSDSFDTHWDDEISSWLESRRSKWNEEIAALREGIFKLEPDDDFGLNKWDPFGTSLGNQNTSSVSQEHYSKKTSVVNGNETSETTHSSSSHSGSGTFHTSGFGKPLLDRSSFGNDDTFGFMTQNKSNSDFLKDAYEIGEDGQLHFKVRFDAKDFKPENIKVSTRDNRLYVNAKQVIETATSKSSKEFSRSIDLPSSIDLEKFKCHLTEDGVLSLDAPVKTPEYGQITFKDGIGIKPGRAEDTFSRSLMKATGNSGPTIVTDEYGRRKVHVEVAVDAIFQPDDFCIKVEKNKIHIKGKHEEKTATSSSSKEFSRYYEVPEVLDPMSITANLRSGVLVVEAPLVKN